MRRAFEVAPQADRTEIWGVGECGESPRLIAEDLVLVTYPDVWPDKIFGCNEANGQVVTLDPEGSMPSNVVFELPDCLSIPTHHGVVTIEPHDEDFGALVLQRWPDDPWTQKAERRVLLDPVRIRAVPSSHTLPAHHEVPTEPAPVALIPACRVGELASA